MTARASSEQYPSPMSTSIPTAISTSPALSPATWRTAFWTPTTLCVSVMSHPYTRVVGFPSLNPIYYLSAPTTCIADAIMVPIRLCVYRIKLPASFSSCLRLVVRHRFAEPDENRETEADKLRERRYAVFLWWLLSVVANSCIVMPRHGINWILCTKVFGVIFLTSLAVVAILVICSRKMDLNQNPLPDDADDDESNQRLQDAEKIAKYLEDVILMFANALHAWLVIYALVNLWPEQRHKYPWGAQFPLRCMRLLFEISCASGTVKRFLILFRYSLKPRIQYQNCHAHMLTSL